MLHLSLGFLLLQRREQLEGSCNFPTPILCRNLTEDPIFIQLALQAVMPIITFAASFIVPESPRYATLPST